MVAGPFMVMNSDARHPKEFSTENTLGGDSVLRCDAWFVRAPANSGCLEKDRCIAKPQYILVTF